MPSPAKDIWGSMAGAKGKVEALIAKADNAALHRSHTTLTQLATCTSPAVLQPASHAPL